MFYSFPFNTLNSSKCSCGFSYNFFRSLLPIMIFLSFTLYVNFLDTLMWNFLNYVFNFDFPLNTISQSI